MEEINKKGELTAPLSFKDNRLFICTYLDRPIVVNEHDSYQSTDDINTSPTVEPKKKVFFLNSYRLIDDQKALCKKLKCKRVSKAEDADYIVFNDKNTKHSVKTENINDILNRSYFLITGSVDDNVRFVEDPFLNRYLLSKMSYASFINRHDKLIKKGHSFTVSPFENVVFTSLCDFYHVSIKIKELFEDAYINRVDSIIDNSIFSCCVFHIFKILNVISIEDLHIEYADTLIECGINPDEIGKINKELIKINSDISLLEKRYDTSSMLNAYERFLLYQILLYRIPGIVKDNIFKDVELKKDIIYSLKLSAKVINLLDLHKSSEKLVGGKDLDLQRIFTDKTKTFINEEELFNSIYTTKLDSKLTDELIKMFESDISNKKLAKEILYRTDLNPFWVSVIDGTYKHLTRLYWYEPNVKNKDKKYKLIESKIIYETYDDFCNYFTESLEIVPEEINYFIDNIYIPYIKSINHQYFNPQISKFRIYVPKKIFMHLSKEVINKYNLNQDEN